MAASNVQLEKQAFGVREASLAWSWRIGRQSPLVSLSKIVEACLVPPKV